MKKALIILISLLTVSWLYANVSTTIREVNANIENAKLCRKSGNVKLALEYAQSAKIMSLSLKDTLKIGNSYIQEGLAFKYLDELDSAFMSYQNALNFFSAINNKERMASTSNNLSAIKEMQGIYIQGISYGKQAYNYISRDTSRAIRLLKAKIYNNIANNFDQLNQLDSAISYNLQALEIVEFFEYQNETEADAAYGLGNRLGEQQKYRASSEYYKTALKYYEEVKDTATVAWIYENIGINERDLRKYQSAEQYFEQSRQKLEELGDSSSLSNLYFNWSLLYRDMEQINQALDKIKLAINYALDKKDENLDLHKNSLEALVELKAKEEKRIQLVMMVIALVATILAILFLFGWLYLKKKQELIDTKNRFSKIKHDKIKNLAIQIKYLLISLSMKDSTNTDLLKARRKIERLIKHAEAPDDGLPPDEFQPKKLRLFVSDMYQHASESFLTKKIQKPEEEYFAAAEDCIIDAKKQQIIIYNIISNAFNNIDKHANCSTASLEVKATPNRMTIIITDDGDGFSEKTIRDEAKGLTHIKEAVNELNGTINIKSSLGNGTKLEIMIPKPFIDEE